MSVVVSFVSEEDTAELQFRNAVYFSWGLSQENESSKGQQEGIAFQV